MKVLYLWVLNHRLLGRQEFSFCDQYHFKFNYETKCLECLLNNKYPSELYKSNNVELISYIIGDNGDGKTTLLNLLMRILPYDGGIGIGDGKNYLKYIYVLKMESSDSIYIYSTLDEIKIKKPKDLVIMNCRDNTITRMQYNSGNFFACQEMKDTSVIFHSNVFDRNRYNNQEVFYGVKDISFNGLLKTDFEYRTTGLEDGAKIQLRVFLDSEMMRQIKFISENSDGRLKEWISFPLPQKLYIHFKDDSEVLDSIYRYDKSAIEIDCESTFYEYDRDKEVNISDLDSLRKVLAHICRDIMKQYDKLYKESPIEFQYLLYRGILMSCLKLIFPETVGMGTTKQYQKIITHLREFMRNFNFVSNVGFIEKLIHIADIDTDKLLNAIVEINDFASNMKKYRIENQAFQFYFLTESNDKAIIDFYRLFRITAFGADYLTFQWEGLSSGEYNLLNMYSRIYSLYDDIKDKKSIILLMDEADLSYHPKWQQKFMKNLVKFFNEFYNEKHIQIIIATHSPIMLSDALKGNVVFLNDKVANNLENTFCANIYDLYREGMFLEQDDWGIIGTYAADKLTYVMEKLDNWEKDYKLDEIKRLIDCIGEPIIKRIMQNKVATIEQNMEGKHTNDMMSSLIEKLNELQPEQLAEVMERIKKN